MRADELRPSIDLAQVPDGPDEKTDASIEDPEIIPERHLDPVHRQSETTSSISLDSSNSSDSPSKDTRSSGCNSKVTQHQWQQEHASNICARNQIHHKRNQRSILFRKRDFRLIDDSCIFAPQTNSLLSYMDSSNLWNRRSNNSKLSLSTGNNSSESQTPRGWGSAKRWGPTSAHTRTSFNQEDTKSPAATTPGTGASSAFGLGSGAFASFAASNKSRTSLGAASDSTASPARERTDKDEAPATTKTPKTQTSTSSLSNSTSSLNAEHLTRHSWVIWYRPPTSKYTDYEKSIAPVAQFATVEQFWTIYARLKNPSALPTVSDYHIFKKGVRPVWEDEENRKGGKWIMRLRKGVCDRYWEDLLLILVGDQFEGASEEVCGVVLSVKAGEDVLSIWTRIDGGKNIKIRETVKRLLSLPPDTNIVWKSHDDSIAQRSELDKAHQDKTKGGSTQSGLEKNGFSSKK